MMRYLLCFILSIIFLSAFGQDPMAEKMEWYGKANPSSDLFVHFDKNVYSTYETVWFTGYLWKRQKERHKIMAVSLIRNVDSTLILTKKFAMQFGLCFGNFEIPDSLQTGDYHFLAYTDQLVNGRPESIFIQQITLKTVSEPPFKASMKLLNPLSTTDKNYKVLVAVTTNESRFLTKPVNISYRYGNDQKSGKTNASGEFLMTLPYQNTIKDPNVYVKLTNQKDSTFISMAVPILKNKASVKFYPEGGHMVEGVPTIVGFEVKDQQQMPISTKAFLYKNQTVIDTVETNSYGLGRFRLRYDKGANYNLKLIHDGVVDSIYQLPSALVDGITLNIANAVATDTLKMQIKSKKDQQVFIRLHNYRETFLYAPFNVQSLNRIVKIPLNNVVKGLVVVTICDSLDRPLAERLIFAHYDSKKKLVLSTNQTAYNQREKVDLKLHLTDTAANGFLSVAVVQNNRIEIKKMNDIESFLYLKNLLGNLPIHVKGLPLQDSVYTEQLLLIKGWRKYNWNELQQTKAIDTLLKKDSLTFTAQVMKGKKMLDKPISVGAFGDSKIRLANTSNTGLVDLNHDDFMNNEKKNLYLFINDKNKLSYQINVQDKFLDMSKKLSKLALNEELILPSTVINNAVLVIKGNEKSIRLKEVVITNKNDNSFMGTYGRNACGDYVCRFNNFNCPNHPYESDNRQPQIGRTYGHLTGPYQGCTTSKDGDFVMYDHIRFGKEFYTDDYKDPLEPAFFSTLYWNYGILMNGKNDVDLSFHTSDITGKFKVVVQGVIDNNATYAEHFFEVKANPVK